MKTDEALKIIGGSLSKPSKMPGWSIGLPAKECKTGGKLQAVPGSVCYDCYALKGCYVFKVVQDAQYRRLAAIKSPQWVDAMAHLINSKKPDVFRWHDSGDVQDLDHLMKIFEVCELTHFEDLHQVVQVLYVAAVMPAKHVRLFAVDQVGHCIDPLR